MRDNPIRTVTCPHCRKRLDMATDPYGSAQPGPGDVTICFDCGHILVFGHDMRARNPTREEQIRIAGDAKVLRTQKLIAEFKRGKGS